MRSSEIRIGMSYAAIGKEIALAKVLVLGRDQKDQVERRFRCRVEQGSVYAGWHRKRGALDMDYRSEGEEVWLQPRDILRPWAEEQERRSVMMARRQDIRALLSEMDALLNDMNLPDSQVQLVPLEPDRFIAVTVLGIEEIRRLHDLVQRTDDQGTVG
jgi:hypothetical protein